MALLLTSHSKSDKQVHHQQQHHHHHNQQQKQQPQKHTTHRRQLGADDEIDVELNKYPYSIVWCPLPFVTWFLPWIGHIGIANSRGIIYDFSDDFEVSVDNFSFGSPTKYYQLEVDKLSAPIWDKAITDLSDYYSKTRHSLCFNNCHEYIAQVLNKVHYDQTTSWTQYDVCGMITFKSSYVGCCGFIRQWGPLVLILAVATVFLVLAIK